MGNLADLILVVHLSPPLCAVFLFCFLCESCDIPFRWFTPDVGISPSKKTRNAEFLPPSIFSPFPTTLAPDTDTLPTTVPYISALPEIRGDLRVLWSFLISASPRITARSTTRPDVTCAFSNTAAFPPHGHRLISLPDPIYGFCYQSRPTHIPEHCHTQQHHLQSNRCQRRFEIVRKRRRNFVIFRRGG